MRSKQSRTLIFFTSIIITYLTCSPSFAATNLSNPILSGQIRKVSMEKFEEVCVPLYGARSEDQNALQNLEDLLKQLISINADITTLEHLPDASDFDYKMDVQFSNNTYLKLIIDKNSILSFEYNDVTKQLKDSQLVSKIKTFFIPIEEILVNQTQSKLGQSLEISGIDPLSENEEIKVFIHPIQKQHGVKKSKSRVWNTGLPSNDMLLIHTSTMSFGRFQLKFDLPPYGKDHKGNMQAITSGQWHLDIVTPSSIHLKNISITKSETPLLTINNELFNSSDHSIMMIQNRLMIPLKAVATIVGKTVTWDEHSKRVLIDTSSPISNVSKTTSETIELWVRGKKILTDVPPFFQGDTIYVPLRITLETLNFSIYWNPINQVANINL